MKSFLVCIAAACLLVTPSASAMATHEESPDLGLEPRPSNSSDVPPDLPPVCMPVRAIFGTNGFLPLEADLNPACLHWIVALVHDVGEIVDGMTLQTKVEFL